MLEYRQLATRQSQVWLNTRRHSLATEDMATGNRVWALAGHVRDEFTETDIATAVGVQDKHGCKSRNTGKVAVVVEHNEGQQCSANNLHSAAKASSRVNLEAVV